jgi:hypothetical protein
MIASLQFGFRMATTRVTIFSLLMPERWWVAYLPLIGKLAWAISSTDLNLAIRPQVGPAYHRKFVMPKEPKARAMVMKLNFPTRARARVPLLRS